MLRVKLISSVTINEASKKIICKDEIPLTFALRRACFSCSNVLQHHLTLLFPYAKNNIYTDPLTLIPTISYTFFPSSSSPFHSLLSQMKNISFPPSVAFHVIHISRSVNFFSFIHISISREWWRKSDGNDSDHHHFFSLSVCWCGGGQRGLLFVLFSSSSCSDNQMCVTSSANEHFLRRLSLDMVEKKFHKI